MAGTWPWNPTRILREVKAFPTNSSVVLVETDLGEGYLKPLSSRSSPHPLACELVGTMLAAWLGLRTLDYGLIEVREEFRPQLADGNFAEVGPGYITRAEEGIPWSGQPSGLECVSNPDDIARLVVFDTWTQNCDRYLERPGDKPRVNFGNVLLVRNPRAVGMFHLTAIDQGCCFTCDNELTTRRLSATADDRIYGWFPGFRSAARYEDAVRAVERLESITATAVEGCLSQVPAEWQVTSAVRTAWCDWILTRARRVRAIIERELRPVDLLDGVTDQGGQP